MRLWVASAYLSDHVYNWSDSTTVKYIIQPSCFDLARSSNRSTSSKSEWASNRRGGKPGESDGDGSAQSVHSRAILKLPRSNSRRISVSTPATRRFLSTSKRRLRRGWKG